MKKQNPCQGQTVESFFEEEEMLEEANALFLKTMIAVQVRAALVENKMTQTELAKKMGTSRAAIQRILDPNNDSMTLHTLKKVAHHLGKKLHVRFLPEEGDL